MRGKRENTNSLKYQGRQELIQFFKNGYGTSKHEDKMSNLQTSGKYQPNQDKIYTQQLFTSKLQDRLMSFQRRNATIAGAI